MKRIYIIAFIFLSWTTVQAQSFTVDWVKAISSPGFVASRVMALDNLGNSYVTGFITDLTDFDPSVATYQVNTSGGYDIFIVKLDANGGFVWAKTLGGINNDSGVFVTCDNNGSVIITGDYDGTVDFNPGAGNFNLTSNGQRDIFILKLDTNGNFVWAKSLGGSTNDVGVSLATDLSGNILITGAFWGTMDIDPGPATNLVTSSGSGNTFILKLNASGDYLWGHNIGNSSYCSGSGITVDDASNVYITGPYESSVDFDPGPGSFILTAQFITADIYILKLNSNGDFIWAKSVGGSSDDYSRFIHYSNGNIYLTGSHQGAADFDPGPGTAGAITNGDQEIFILKLNNNGDFVWVNSYGSTGVDYGTCIATNTIGEIYLACKYQNSVDFNPNGTAQIFTSNGSDDICLIKLDPNGDYNEAVSFGSTSFDNSLSIAMNNSDVLHMTGWFGYTVDFDPYSGINNVTSVGSSDCFVMKFGGCPASNSTDTQNACDSYTWIDGNTYTANNSSATHTLTNVAGCDSIVTLNLTINTSPIVNAGSDALICAGESIVLTGTGALTYTWTSGLGTTVTDGVPFIPSQSDTYTSTGLDINGCSGTDDVYIEVEELPVASYFADVTSGCAPLTVMFTNTSTTASGASLCNWSFGDGNGGADCSNITNIYPNPGLYDVTLDVTSNSGCIGSITYQDYIFVDDCSGLEETVLNSVNVFPNPVNENLTIEFGDVLENVFIQLLNTSGQELITQEVQNSEHSILELDKIPAGIYYLKLISKDLTRIVKVMKL